MNNMTASLALVLAWTSLAGAAALRTTPALHRGPDYARLAAALDGPAGQLNLDPRLHLAGMDPDNRPVYYETHSVIAAQSIGLQHLWPGGSTGLNLTGAGSTYIGMWDQGRPLHTHQEIVGRSVQQDDPSSTATHSTAVAGILIAQGLQAGVRGMAPAAVLACWDWQDDVAEVGDAAYAGLLLSSHSYGSSTGWNYTSPNWYWHGDPTINPVEDANFGRYSATSRQLDEVAWLSDRLLMVRSAGNHRQDLGPAEGVPHFVFSGGLWVSSTVTRERDGGVTGFDSLGPEALAKNVLTVGAVNDLPNGWTQPADVVLTSYSSFGPADDGRIKPDLVANGTSLMTISRTGNAAYASFSGTSAACPTVAGALVLLQQLYQSGHGDADGSPRRPLSATMRGLMIQTASEAGASPGPDYQAGWGLANVLAAANLVADDNLTRRRMLEGRLAVGSSALVRTRALGGPVRATLCWTDPPGTVPVAALDDPSPRLVHDLELEGYVPGQQTLRSWVLNPAQPQAPAQATGNHRDNVERLDAVLEAGSECYLSIHAESPLTTAQTWSLLLDGLEPVAELIPVASRPLFGLGDTLLVDIYLNGGLALRGVSLRPGWPAGALRLVAADAGPALGMDGHAVDIVLTEALMDGARVDLNRTGDPRGLDLPSGMLARLTFITQSTLEFSLGFSASLISSAGGEEGHALVSAPLTVNQGQRPLDLELRPENLAPRQH